ncbi:hypothetical protein JTB14_024636 [Gonioctena quinquepunctata]|nr:hypothetical protein JTB14_024636 [Gonioctena quinquepunctata]
MVEENEMKDKYITQIRLDEKTFVEDAIKNEEELKELINIQEKEILKATEKIVELETQLRRYINKETADSETHCRSYYLYIHYFYWLLLKHVFFSSNAAFNVKHLEHHIQWTSSKIVVLYSSLKGAHQGVQI